MHLLLLLIALPFTLASQAITRDSPRQKVTLRSGDVNKILQFAQNGVKDAVLPVLTNFQCAPVAKEREADGGTLKCTSKQQFKSDQVETVIGTVEQGGPKKTIVVRLDNGVASLFGGTPEARRSWNAIWSHSWPAPEDERDIEFGIKVVIGVEDGKYYKGVVFVFNLSKVK